MTKKNNTGKEPETQQHRLIITDMQGNVLIPRNPPSQEAIDRFPYMDGDMLDSFLFRNLKTGQSFHTGAQLL